MALGKYFSSNNIRNYNMLNLFPSLFEHFFSLAKNEKHHSPSHFTTEKRDVCSVIGYA